MAFSTVGAAETLPVTANAVFTVNGQEFTITRVSALEQSSISALIQSSATCVASYLSPMSTAPNVPTLGELDVIEFLSTQVESGDGLLIDARLPEDSALGYIPTSVNIPTATLTPSNPYRDEILLALSAQHYQSVFSFTDAISLMVYDSGPATQDAAALIVDLLVASYPPEKIDYYRGGVQVWTTLGLSTTAAT
jgi:rhodanese-related sulfurtransferase